MLPPAQQDPGGELEGFEPGRSLWGSRRGTKGGTKDGKIGGFIGFEGDSNGCSWDFHGIYLDFKGVSWCVFVDFRVKFVGLMTFDGILPKRNQWPAIFQFCFKVSLICFLGFLLSAVPASLLFLLLCFSAFPFFFCVFAFPVFFLSLLLCFSA